MGKIRGGTVLALEMQQKESKSSPKVIASAKTIDGEKRHLRNQNAHIVGVR